MNTSPVQQSNDAMTQILMMAVTKSTDMAEKMIPISLAEEGVVESGDPNLGTVLDLIA